MKKTLNLFVIISLISVITFITLVITQINFYNSIIYLLISSSVLISSISLKLLEENPKIKLISILAIIINILEFHALNTPDFLRDFKWLTLSPLVILIGIAISQSMKANSVTMINKLGSFSSIILTLLLVVLTVFNITSKWFFTLTFIFLITTTLSFAFSFLKKSPKE